MRHLLMIESWVGAMSTLLPRAVHEAGHRFSFVTRDLGHYLPGPGPGVSALLTARNVLTLDTNDPAALLAGLRPLHDVLGFDGVISSCDYYLTTVASVARELGLPGPDPAAVRRANRKDLTRAALAAAGVAGPRYATADTWTGLRTAALDLGFPLVVKPVDLCAGMFVRRVDDAEQLRLAYDAIASFGVNARQQARSGVVLVEELLDGPEVSVETVTDRGRTTVVGITDKSTVGAPYFVESGHMFPAALPDDVATAVGGLAVAALDALGFDHGVAHTEVKLTTAGPRLVEVNPRPAGNQITELVRRVTGIDLPMVHARLALGESPDLTPRPTGVGSAAIALVIPPSAGVLERVDGATGLTGDRRIVDVTLKPPGSRVAAPDSNNSYLGHVMVVHPEPGAARSAAERAVGGLTPHLHP